MRELKPEAIAELVELDARHRALVLGGLRNKLDHYGRTGRLSYAYEVCPVCRDMGSTEEEPRCDACYIRRACKAPFEEGFRDNVEAGVIYFRSMLRGLERLERSGTMLFVGGSYDAGGGSGFGLTAQRIADALGATEAVTGGTLDVLEAARSRASQVDVTVWMPSVHNEEPKAYPVKRPGAILICAKVMRKGYTRFDSVSRIFRMGANAVIEVHRYEPRGYRFALVDALGNEWVHTEDLHEFADGVDRFLEWARGVIRKQSLQIPIIGDPPAPPSDLPVLVDIVRAVADRVENERGGRYFGNASTRCMAMFPSERSEERVFVSARNVDKQRLEPEDFVCVQMRASLDAVYYYGSRKPSVDTPVQLKLYQRFPWLRYMIHGHAFAEGALTTSKYFPCGDMREVGSACDAVLELETKGQQKHAGAINLKGHGFLLYSDTLEALRGVVAEVQFRNVVPAPGAGTKANTCSPVDKHEAVG
jgi:ribulose-5-phosphate 4-epimerase/fuculose-1-phosphate aldolase